MADTGKPELRSCKKIQSDIRAIEAQIEGLAETQGILQEEFILSREAELGLVRDVTVVISGSKEFLFRRLSKFEEEDEPWILACLRLKDGSWSTNERQIYRDWKVIR